MVKSEGSSFPSFSHRVKHECLAFSGFEVFFFRLKFVQDRPVGQSEMNLFKTLERTEKLCLFQSLHYRIPWQILSGFHA